jgi:putative SOS response-associated peptidase YedK
MAFKPKAIGLVGDHAIDPEEVPDTLKGLLRPFDAQLMEAYPVSTFVNSPRNQGEQCRERVA